MNRWTKYVAVGDSFTEGLNDTDGSELDPATGTAPESPGRFVGWADRLAGLLAQDAPDPSAFRYANLAVRGRLLADIGGDQRDAARELPPEPGRLGGGGS